MLLTDEEINTVIDKVWEAEPTPDTSDGECLDAQIGDAVAKAQLKKVVEWGDGECIEHPTCKTTVLLRRECDKCWQALLDEVKD